MTVYGTGNYTQTGYTTEGYERERVRAQEMSDLHKSMADWQAVFRTRLEQWGRHGPSDALRAQIAEAAKEIGDIVDAIMSATPPMLAAPKRDNRY
jgi:glutathione S-transferase